MGLFSKTQDQDTTKKASSKKAVDNKEVITESSMQDLYSGTVATTTSTKEVKKIRKIGNAYRVLVKPLITEKATNLGAENKYVFVVSNTANKISVTGAIEEVYGVKPVAVNIMKVEGKMVRYGRTRGQRKDWKKAIVTLPKGKTINIYEGV
jgi:large subunit ribosomal protein L23